MVKNKKRSRTSKLARAKGVNSEKYYVERLKKQLGAVRLFSKLAIHLDPEFLILWRFHKEE